MSLTSRAMTRLPTRKVMSSRKSSAPARAGAGGERRRDARGGGTIGDKQGQEGASRAGAQRPVEHIGLPVRPSACRARAEVHPGLRACLVAPTACHGPASTPAGDGSGEQHARRPREQACCMDGFAAEQSLRDAGLSSLMVLDTYSPITEVRCSNQSRDVISSGAPSNTVRRGMPCQHRHVSRLMALTISGRGVTAATAERRGAAASRSPSWRCAEIAILAENRRRNYIGAFILLV